MSVFLVLKRRQAAIDADNHPKPLLERRGFGFKKALSGAADSNRDRTRFPAAGACGEVIRLESGDLRLSHVPVGCL